MNNGELKCSPDFVMVPYWYQLHAIFDCFSSLSYVGKGGTYHREFINDLERCEYFVPVEWLQTVPQEQAVDEIGLFGNRNTVCLTSAPMGLIEVIV